MNAMRGLGPIDAKAQHIENFDAKTKGDKVPRKVIISHVC